jgi:Leucine-rich repeat (LRR) protein
MHGLSSHPPKVSSHGYGMLVGVVAVGFLCRFRRLLWLWSPLLVTLLTIVGVEGACQGAISAAEYDGLESLYVSANGANWHWNYSDPDSIWQFPVNVTVPCESWYGIECLSKTVGCTIYSMDLSSFGLEGSLPANIGNLTGLVVLTLRANTLHGQLPDTITNLLDLVELDLNTNDFSGQIPVDIWQLTVLSDLDLSFNRFTNVVPTTIGQVCSLNFLNLAANLLESSLPINLFQLTALADLDLEINMFTGGLAGIENMTMLSSISMSLNYFSGEVIRYLQKVHQLASVNAINNMFEGAMSSEFLALEQLTVVNLDRNLLSGSMPELLPSATLSEFAACCNLMTGSIPKSIGNLSQLTSFDMRGNTYLSGVLPDSICTISLLEVLHMNECALSGSMPPCLGSLNALLTLDFDYNLLTGPLVTGFASMEDLNVAENKLSGVLLSGLGSMGLAVDFILAFNYLSCTVPSEYADLISVNVFDISNNLLTGSLPPSLFARMSHLQSIVVGANSLTGAFPDILNDTSSIVYVYLNGNCFDGSLPSVFTTCVKLEELFIASNCFSGDLSRLDWQNINDLTTLQANNNLFSGPFPTHFNELASLQAVYLYENYLTNTLPATLGNVSFLVYLNAGNNFMSGSVPNQLANAILMEVLNMSSNLMTGTISGLFMNESVLPRLKILDLSDNGLAGPIPSMLFNGNHERAKVLKDVLMYSNCFDSGIPDSICAAENMSALVLDSMSSAGACRRQFGAIHSLFPVTISTISQHGVVPSCVWKMPNMQTLHLSGNGLQGSLEDIDPAVTKLNDVSLASNRLIGTIPLSWQLYGRFLQLDLSFNKLSGGLNGGFNISADNINLDLTVNRLSGRIPGAFMEANSINILDGNLFQCNYGETPVHDPDSHQYTCGSDNFDIYLIIFTTLLVVVVSGCVWFRGILSKQLAVHFSLGSEIQVTGFSSSSLDLFVAFLDDVAKWCSYATAGILGVTLCFYVIVKLVDMASVFYSTHKYQYAWTTTATYLHGIAPTVAIIIFVVIGVMLLRRFVTSLIVPVTESSKNCTSGWTWVTSLTLLVVGRTSVGLCAHMIVTTAVNLMYVYGLIRGLAPGVLILLQMLLSLFKLGWNALFVRKIVRWMGLSITSQLVCQCFMVMFTFLVSPLIAIFFLDYNCFRYIILGQPSVSSSFYVDSYKCHTQCITVETQVHCFSLCAVSPISPVTSSSTVVPSWQYSYQCSSSLLKNYAPVLLFAFTVSGLVIPVVKLCAHRYEGNLPRFATKLLIGNLTKPLHSFSNDICKLCLNISVVLTFGLACPLLCVSVCLDTWTARLISRLAIVRKGRSSAAIIASGTVNPIALQHGSDGGKTSFCVSTAVVPAGTENIVVPAVRDTVNLIDDGLQYGLWLAVMMASAFWSFFVFDMVGDVYDSTTGGWAAGVGVFVIMVAYGQVGRVHGGQTRPREFLKHMKDGGVVTPVDLNEEFL